MYIFKWGVVVVVFCVVMVGVVFVDIIVCVVYDVDLVLFDLYE